MGTSLTVRRRARLLAILLAACGTLPAWARQTPPPTFRGSTDVIAVDVQVIGRDGQPVTGLTPDQFEVTINGQRRQVISATFIDAYGPAGAPATPAVNASPAPSDEAAVLLPPELPARRIVILAIDCASLDVAAAREASMAAIRFIEELPASDLVGLFSFPLGPRVDPTTDRVELTRALDGVVGQELPTRGSRFDFRPSDLVDLSQCHSYSPGSPSNRCDEVAKWFCGNDDLWAEFYARLAGETGGMVETVGPNESLSSIFRRMLTAFRQRHLLHFVPRGVEPAGFHALDVRVKRNAVEVRARRGYTWR